MFLEVLKLSLRELSSLFGDNNRYDIGCMRKLRLADRAKR